MDVYAVNGINIFGKNTGGMVSADSDEAAIASAKDAKVIAPMVEKIPMRDATGTYQTLLKRYEAAEAVAKRTLALIERGQYLAAKEAEKSYTYKD